MLLKYNNLVELKRTNDGILISRYKNLYVSDLCNNRGQTTEFTNTLKTT